jgi:hypothetical protein
LMPRRQPRRKKPLVPVTGEDAAAVAREFVGEILPWGYANDGPSP